MPFLQKNTKICQHINSFWELVAIIRGFFRGITLTDERSLGKTTKNEFKRKHRTETP